MSPRLSLFVLSAFFILLLPLPVYLNGSGLLPAGEIIIRVFMQADWLDGVVLFAQGLIAITVCIVVARFYITLSETWPLKIRGSVVGIISLLMVVTFSSISVYKSFGSSSQDSLELRELYHW
ncbi:MAG: hypothetical protein ACJAQS_000104 [Porticoccus sp.]|jgi:hypothetical protein